ncbi:MAG: M23 family metallopeptidase [Treponema sp.]|nr:M23 family metallopeptidase [Treponema sp.]
MPRLHVKGRPAPAVKGPAGFFGRLGVLFVLAALLPPSGSRAMDWPAGEGAMANNFGWNREARPVLGTIFETEGPVRAAEDADILFIHDIEDSASVLPSPLGTWAALDHGDGLISIYSRLDETEALPVLESVSRGRLIARAGKSGMAGENGFYFTFFDRKERRWINPVMIIAPPQDTAPPQILAVELRDGDGQAVNPAQARSLRQGRYTVLVNAVDSLGERRPATLAPYRILCSVNGIETGVLSFETFSARDGVLMAYRNGLVPVKQIYTSGPAYEIGEISLTRGQAAIEIIAQDISGNTRNAVFRLQVE